MPKFEDEIIKGVFEEREVAPEQKHPTFDSEMAFYNLVAEGKIVETVVTTKVSRSMPARTSTTIKKTMSAKTADASDTVYWGGTLLGAIAALFVWMRFEQKRK